MLLLCCAVSLAQAQKLIGLKTLRHDNWEVRAAYTGGTGNFAIAIMDNADIKAQLSSTCSQGTLENDHVCLVINRPNGHYHKHLPLRNHLRAAKEILLRHNHQHLEIIADGRLLSRSFAPSSFKGTLNGSVLQDGTPCLKDIRYQRLEPIQFGDDFMRTEEEAKQLGLWKPVTGNWKIYSVMERIQANPAARIRPGKIPVADRSPNPFTLSGQSAEKGDAVILTGQLYWNNYRVAATAKPGLGTAAGIVFSAKDNMNFWYCKWTLSSFGTKQSPFQLIQRINGVDIVRDTVFAKGRANNWTRLEVETAGRCIRAYADSALLMEFYSDTCTGGQIGLFTQGMQETHFDDIDVRSIQALPMTAPQDLLECASEQLKESWKITQAADLHAALAPQKKNAQITFGDASWKGQRTEMTFRYKKPLVFASSFDKAGFRFGKGNTLEASCVLKNNVLFLELMDTASQKPLQQMQISNVSDDAPLRLALDTTNRDIIELWLNHTLALRHAAENLPVQGPVTLFATDTKVTFENLVFFAEHPRDWEQPVDITRFAEDPYMQGWASPRYVWLRTREINDFPQLFTFTGDIYGAFKLKTPIIHRLNYTFGNDDLTSREVYVLSTAVKENAASADISLTRGGKMLFNASISNIVKEKRPGTQIIDEKIGARPPTPDTVCWGDVTFHRDGYALWLEYKGKTVASAYDPTPLTGRALNVHVPAPMDFIHISLDREHIKDYLFEKAEADFASLGRWEVTNRFACDPRWSFMNGESFGTAALTTKYDIAGDYTIECFAGMRMRQGELKENGLNYPRVGDINVAMQTNENDLFSGYNLIIQAWDPKWSESQTQFRKRADVVATSNMELIPRGRERSPKTRNIALDWDPGGRPVHGAWYALKIRKTRSHFDVFFDNQQVFSYTDDSPLPDFGRIALWTQHNSIVLARVKINYRTLRIPSRLCPPPDDTMADIDTSALPPMEISPMTNGKLTADGGILAGITPLNGDQSAEISTVAPNARLLVNANPGGDFAVAMPKNSMKNLLAASILEFDLATSADAQLNVYVIPENDSLPHLFFPICGPREDGAKLRNIGSPKITIRKKKAMKNRDWLHVSIPLVAQFRKSFPWYKGSLDARHVIIGMLHEGYLNAGLHGNSANAWALLGNMVLTKQPPQENTLRLQPKSPENNGVWGLNTIEIAVDAPEYIAVNLSTAALTVNGEKYPLNSQNTCIQDGILRIMPALKQPPDKNAQFVFSCVSTDGQEHRLEWTARVNTSLDRTAPAPPRIKDCLSFLTDSGQLPNFITVLKDTEVTSYTASVRPSGLPAIDVTAQVCASRIPLTIPVHCKNIASHPLVFFDARIPADTLIDMRANFNGSVVHYNLTDKESAAQNIVMDVSGIYGDGQWHTLQADLFGAWRSLQKQNIHLQPSLSVLDFQNFIYSGTGPGASYGISNLRFAKLATTLVPLQVTWRSSDLNKISHCAFEWSQEPDTEPDGTQCTENDIITAPTLPQGLNFLHIKACDANGNWSLTTHQPFFIDNAQPKVNRQLPDIAQLSAPETLEATLTQDAFGVDFTDAQLTVNNNNVPMRRNFWEYEESTRKLTLNLLRTVNDFSTRMTDKTNWTVSISNAQNAAGTTVEPINWKWQLDFSKDSQPPHSPDIYFYKNNLSRGFRSFESEIVAKHNAKQMSQVVVDDISHSKCLDVMILKNRGTRMVRLSGNGIDFGKLRTIAFDIRVFPKSNVSLFIQFGTKWRLFSINAPGIDNTIGSCTGISDNGQWKHVSIDFKKDILDKLTAGFAGKTPTQINIGCFDNNPKEQHFRLDNVSFTQDLPPVSPLLFAMQDATGIGTIAAKTALTADDWSVDDVSEPMLDRKEPYYLMFNTSNTVYLNSQIKDGAGNQSPVEHYALCCSNPVQSVNGGNTLDDFDKYPWNIDTLNKKQSLRMFLKHLTSSDGKDKVLTVYFYGAKHQGAFLCTSVQKLPGNKPDECYTADLHLSALDSEITVSLVLLDADKSILAESQTVTLKPADTWKRNTDFPLKKIQNTENARTLAFKIYPGTAIRGILTIDNIRQK